MEREREKGKRRERCASPFPRRSIHLLRLSRKLAELCSEGYAANATLLSAERVFVAQFVKDYQLATGSVFGSESSTCAQCGTVYLQIEPRCLKCDCVTFFRGLH